MADQIPDNVVGKSGIIDNADKCRPQFNIGDILHHISSDSAVHLHDPSYIPAARDILRQRISLHVYK